MDTDARKHILVVEDDRDTRILIRRALQLEDYVITLAETGQKALEHLQNETPDLILLDLSMPAMDGADLMSAIRARPNGAELKVVLVSGWDDLRSRAATLGADGFIRKPFSLDQLLSDVAKYLRA